MKKSALALIVLVLVATLVSACGKKENDASGSANGSNGQDGSEPVSLSVMAPQSNSVQNLDVNQFSKHLEQKLNIKFKWQATPEAAFEDKKQLAMVSGDYPAVILNAAENKANQIKYGQQGVFVPLNELIEQHAPNIQKALEEVDGFKSAMTAPDGNIYALPKINECLHCTYYQRVWINTAWLDELGLKMPTTTDEFYTVLKAFKEQDPNGNGLADEIPFTTTANDAEWGDGVDPFLMNAFIYNDDNTYLSVKDGKVIYSPMQTEWREGLRYLNKLYQEGLIDKGSFTQNSDAVKQLANKEDPTVGVIAFAVIGSGVNYPRNKDYAVLPPLKGPAGVQLAGYNVGFGNGDFVITNKATEEEKIAAIRLADYLYSEEGTVISSYGFEGEGWKMAEEGQLDYNGNPAQYDVIPQPQVDKVNLANTWWQLGTIQMLNTIRESFVAPEDPLGEGDGAREYRFWLSAKQYEPFARPEVVYPKGLTIKPEDALTLSQIEKTLTDYVKTNMAQFITGNKSLDKNWDSYVDGFKGLQLEQYLNIRQAALDERNAAK